ncbi:hypothetical protein DLM46_11230 [Paraburkholderia lacunae]|uniref:Uncharacterized protein n=1 Tax=Paraburkholderia lacunae TaxID=2211104 RepID=A0A370NB34_9BURK|nr:hypothetical protein DLM46_11230 [Paraburkholderia lacunae]
MFEQYETRVAVERAAAINGVLALPIRHDFTVRNGAYFLVSRGRVEMHTGVPAAVERDRIDTMRQFEIVHDAHHRVGEREVG